LVYPCPELIVALLLERLNSGSHLWGVSKVLGLGKLPSGLLERYVLGRLGAPSGDVVLGPKVGVDFGAINLGKGYLIVSSDPVTGSLEHAGWIAVHVSANDVATSGNPPRYLQMVILLPEDSDVRTLSRITSEVDRAARGLGLSVVGGHTEVTPGLRRPIVCATCFTYAETYVSADQAKAGDVVILTKTAGLEGTAILGGASARRLLASLSVVGEAVEAYRSGGVHAMHDCTEGGVLGALYEMAKSSHVGFRVYEEKIPVHPLTRRLSAKLKLDPLRLISSGSLLIAAKPSRANQVVSSLRSKGYSATIIGRFTRKHMVVVRSNGAHEQIRSEPVDELWRLQEHMRINEANHGSIAG